MDLSERRGGASRRHPWETARANFFRETLRRARPFDRPLRVLDVGAGDGFLAGALQADLPPGSRMVCFDANYTDQDLADFRAATPDVTFTRDRPQETFDVLLLLDVIEHVPDDGAFLRDLIQGNLADEGTVVVSVPAWQGLFSKHDEALRHFRRYSPAGLRQVIDANGLAVHRFGGLFHSLMLPRAVSVLREHALRLLGKEPDLPPAADEWRAGPLISSAVDRLLALDTGFTNACARVGLSLPGLSVWAVCRRAGATPAAAGRAGE